MHSGEKPYIAAMVRTRLSFEKANSRVPKQMLLGGSAHSSQQQQLPSLDTSAGDSDSCEAPAGTEQTLTLSQRLIARSAAPRNLGEGGCRVFLSTASRHVRLCMHVFAAHHCRLPQPKD